MQKRLLILAAILLVGVLPVVALAQVAAAQPQSPNNGQSTTAVADLVINEVMADNSGTITDTSDLKNNEDWIEIYNSGGTAVNLQGLYLSDDGANLTKHHITQSLPIAPNSYLILWADEDTADGPAHLGFKLSASGESVFLVGSNGTTIIHQVSFGTLATNQSAGLLPNGNKNGTFGILPNPTPGQKNDQQPPIIQNVTPVFSTGVHPSAGQSVNVTADITDLDGTISNATLIYFNGASDVSVPMALSSGSTYAASIPGLGNGTVVSYYISAQDNDNNLTVAPEEAPDQRFGYQVGYSRPKLSINEFMADNRNTLPDPANPLSYTDWIELYNYGTTAINLGNYTISDNLNNPAKASLPGISIASGEYLLFYADGGVTADNFHLAFGLGDNEEIGLFGAAGFDMIDGINFSARKRDFSTGHPNNDPSRGFEEFEFPTPGYSNTAQPLVITGTNRTPAQPDENQAVTINTTILSSKALVATRLYYSINSGSYISVSLTAGAGNSYSAVINNPAAKVKGAHIQYYIYAEDASRVQERDPQKAPSAAAGDKDTYGYIVGFTPPSIVINEFMASNQNIKFPNPALPGQTFTPDWIEIYNSGNTAVDLNGYYIANSTSSEKISGTLMIPAKGYVVLYAAVGSGPQFTDFTLARAGDSITIRGPLNTLVIDSVTFGEQATDISSGKLPNGTGSFRTFHVPTPGSANVLKGPTISSVSRMPTVSGVNIIASVTDDSVALGALVTTTLSYRISGGSFVNVPMSIVNGKFQAQIPTQPKGVLVEYYIAAVDNDGVTTKNPTNAPTQLYSYTTGDALIFIPLVGKP